MGADGIVIWVAPTVGTLVGTPTYANGQVLGRVATPTQRSQTFSVTVPNDPTMWSNAGDTETFTLSDLQEQGIFLPSLVITTVNPFSSGFILQASINEMFGDVTSGRFEYKKASDSVWTSVTGMIAGSGTALNATITGLDSQTDYDLRAYATNEAGEGSSPIVMNTTSATAFQPADIITDITVDVLGGVTVTTNDSGFVYYIGELNSGGQTFTANVNSQTAPGVYPLVDRQTGRIPNIGIQVDDTDAPNDGVQLSIRTIQSALQQPALPNVSTSGGAGFAGTAGEIIEGSINSVGAVADTATFYWIIDDTDRDADYLINNGNSIAANATSGSVIATAVYASSTNVRQLQYVLTASNANGTSSGAVVKQQIATISILANEPITNPATSIGNTDAVFNGDVIIGTGNEVTGLGFIYGTDQAAVAQGVISASGNPIGSGVSVIFESKTDIPIVTPITGLLPNTTYYYATICRGFLGWRSDFTPETFDTTQVTYSGNISYLLPTNVSQSVSDLLSPTSYSGLSDGTTINWSGTLLADPGFEFSPGDTTETANGTVSVPSGGGDINIDLRSSYPVTPIPSPNFTFATINPVQIVDLSNEGLAANSSILLNFNYDYFPNTFTITSALPANGDTSDLRTSINYSISGLIPAGFNNDGDPYTFTGSLNVNQAAASVPNVQTNSATSVNVNTATLQGSVSGGTGSVTDTWFLISDSAADVNAGLGTRIDVVPADNTLAFEEVATGLDPETTYYYRAYASNSIGIGSGGTVSFETDPASIIVLPQVSTLPATTGLLGLSFAGEVNDNGGGTISLVGFELDETGLFVSPTVISAFYDTVNMEFSAAQPVDPGFWSYRAFAENEAGRTYGNVRTITVGGGLTPPL